VEFRLEGEKRVPLRFGRGEALQQVAEVIDRWHGIGHCYFRVRTPDGDCYILRLEESAGTWEVWSFERRGRG
jgi:hypothetical protein